MLPWPVLAAVCCFVVVLYKPLVTFYFFSSVPTFLAHSIVQEETGAVVFVSVWLLVLLLPQIEFRRKNKVSRLTYFVCSLYSLLNAIFAVSLMMV